MTLPARRRTGGPVEPDAFLGARTSSARHGRGTRRSSRCGYQAVLASAVTSDDVGTGPADGALTVTVPKAQAVTARGGKRPP
ncbi:hypothetical protein ACWGIU_00540 [Streptomyces sp. NPDC054840]